MTPPSSPHPSRAKAFTPKGARLFEAAAFVPFGAAQEFLRQAAELGDANAIEALAGLKLQ